MRTAPKWLQWLLKRGGYNAITLPPLGIWATTNHVNNHRLYQHECVHWQQAQRMGLVKYYATYCWYHLRYGYEHNPMEIEARQVSGTR